MIHILFVAALLQQTPQTAPDGVLVPPAATTPPETVSPEEEARLNEVICRGEVVVGTRLNGRVCMTRREWDQRREASRRLAQRMESSNSRRGAPAPASQSGR